MSRKQKHNQTQQEPQSIQIVIEFTAPGLSDPSVTFGKGITPGQIRDAAFLLNAMAEQHVHDMMQQQRIEQAQSRIVVPSAMGGPVGMGGLPS